ncbi:MAG: elongation factor G [Alphaproteobacteria bacterium]
MPGKNPAAPRCAALVGSYLSGKTTLLEALLFATGAIPRKGSARDGSMVGDAAPEARSRSMSTEIAAASTSYLGETWHFLDCPGSVELAHEARAALMVADVAVVVCEPEIEKALSVASMLHFLDEHRIPHILFINKIDHATARVRELMEALQSVSDRKLVLRHVPIRDGETVTGYVDLVSERAYRYEPGSPSKLVELPETVAERNAEARQELLESLADFDDALLEQLLEDTVPDKHAIYAQLAKDLKGDLIVPVFLGAAERQSGVERLLKALRHETPEVAETFARLGGAGTAPLAQVFKTQHMAHAGKLSLARIWRGTVKDGMSFGEHRVSGLFRMKGGEQEKLATAAEGDVVALGRMEGVATGQTLSTAGADGSLAWPAPPAPVYALALEPERREDEVKLSAALAKVMDEDPSLSVRHDPDTGQLLLRGQGDIHLQIAADKLRGRFRVGVATRRPQTPYKETIRKAVQQHARHKKQSGGHGEFGDVHVEVKPLPRGTGFAFVDNISGGVIPRQYIPAVEAGARESLTQGPMGFPVVDVQVTLYDGQYHTVDSSDMAFRRAGSLAMREAMPKCDPVLLEPICRVAVSTPSQFTARAQAVITRRRGQILGFDAKAEWKGWDEIAANMPQSELADLIVELRSATAGAGTFEWQFDHLAELVGREAESILASRHAAQ